MNKSSHDCDTLLARCEALQREGKELARFSLIGQAFLGLVHELNNALNSIMLQTSVLQLRVDEQGQQELAAIRRHSIQAAGLIRTLQQVVQEQREKSYSVDLNSVLTEVLEEETELRSRITLHLSPQAPQIHSCRSAVKQLVRLLLQGVCAGTETAVKAETGEQEGNAILSWTIPGREGEASPDVLLWRNLDEIGRLAGQSLLRQLGGALRSEQIGGAVILRVVWQSSP